MNEKVIKFKNNKDGKIYLKNKSYIRAVHRVPQDLFPFFSYNGDGLCITYELHEVTRIVQEEFGKHSRLGIKAHEDILIEYDVITDLNDNEIKATRGQSIPYYYGWEAATALEKMIVPFPHKKDDPDSLENCIDWFHGYLDGCEHLQRVSYEEGRDLNLYTSGLINFASSFYNNFPREIREPDENNEEDYISGQKAFNDAKNDLLAYGVPLHRIYHSFRYD